MRIQVEIKLIWVSDITLDQSTWKGIAIAVTGYHVFFVGKESEVVSLGANNDGELRLFVMSVSDYVRGLNNNTYSLVEFGQEETLHASNL